MIGVGETAPDFVIPGTDGDEHHEGDPKRALVTVDDTQTVRYTWMTDSAYESPSLDALHQTVTSLVDEHTPKILASQTLLPAENGCIHGRIALQVNETIQTAIRRRTSLA